MKINKGDKVRVAMCECECRCNWPWRMLPVGKVVKAYLSDIGSDVVDVRFGLPIFGFYLRGFGVDWFEKIES